MPFSKSDSESWIKETKKNPSVTDFELTPISNIFYDQDEQLRSIPLNPEDPDAGNLDPELLLSFFSNVTLNYCVMKLGKACPDVKGCAFWNNCTLGDKCIDDETKEHGFRCSKTCSDSKYCREGEDCEDDENSSLGFRCIANECPEGYEQPNGSDQCYRFFDWGMTWMEAQGFCKEEQVNIMINQIA